MNFIPYTPGTEEYDDLVSSYVLANRINDVVAKPSTKRYQSYLALIRGQLLDDAVTDNQQEWREKAKELLPRALEAYQFRHGAKLITGRLYLYADKNVKLAAAPDAVEADLLGLTVHVRRTMESYEAAIERGCGNDGFRAAQAQMQICGFKHWIVLNYFEDAVKRIRRLDEELVNYDRVRAGQLEDAMLAFLMKSRTMTHE